MRKFLTTFTKFTGKHMCWSLFFNKVVDFISYRNQLLDLLCKSKYWFLYEIRPSTLFKKRLQHRCFTVIFVYCGSQVLTKNDIIYCISHSEIFYDINITNGFQKTNLI